MRGRYWSQGARLLVDESGKWIKRINVKKVMGKHLREKLLFGAVFTFRTWLWQSKGRDTCH